MRFCPCSVAQPVQIEVQQRQQVDPRLTAPGRDDRGDVRVDEKGHELVCAGLLRGADVMARVIAQAESLEDLEAPTAQVADPGVEGNPETGIVSST